MATLTEALAHLTALVQTEQIPWPDLQAALQTVSTASQSAPTAARDAALRQIVALLPNLRRGRAAALALLCGALVEQGADPELAWPAILARLPAILADAARCGPPRAWRPPPPPANPTTIRTRSSNSLGQPSARSSPRRRRGEACWI